MSLAKELPTATRLKGEFMLAMNVNEIVVPDESAPSLDTILSDLQMRFPPNLQTMLKDQIENLPPRYFQSIDARGVLTDFTLMERFKDEKVIVEASEAEGRTTLRVLMARDEPRIFLRVVAIFAAHKIGIERALIFTGRKDLRVVDHFVLNQDVSPEELEKIVTRVRETLLDGSCETPPLNKPIRAGLRFQVENHKTQEFTTLTVSASNQDGFLFRIARVFSERKLQLLFASLNTKGDQIVDQFHLVTRAGARLNLLDEVQLRDAIHAAFAK